ncbi:hypothetical protein T265_13948 [Opisthorchis viverrini]|uniref:glutaminyl-peptide cyclotransferase n=1 Tax=Opisthorchis viverrini TaxID=6198 RepID=A0A074ZLW2_OPIVI|nr:hypothetical protein T265_13948 [Opisthorchis viverrini]KER26742.1 hypothetical protein T265_13948 [Opisthorchis viverrini]
MFDYYSCISLVFNFLQLAWIGSQSVVDKNTVNVAPLSNQSLQLVHDSHTIEQLRDIFYRVNVIRQVDSESHRAVGQYISNHFQSLGWVIEWDSFTMNTVIGRKTFRNIIVSLGPPELDFLILACHYDSKSIPGFYGSVDSAMPCAILMKVAESITPLYQSQRNHPYSLRMIFFDGEEAFRDWTDQDSLYGSRHLAAKLFVLLDLIGFTGMTIPSYPNGTKDMYDHLVTLEQRFARENLLHSYRTSGHQYFRGTLGHRVEDDHVPFFELGVPVLHLIPTPFPWVWHTVHDNAQNIDWNASMDFLRLMDAFVRSCLHLDRDESF